MLQPGIMLNQRYVVEHPVGRGGYSIVYAARDTRLGNQRVAIKELNEALIAPAERDAAIAMFQQEATLLANLNHPGIARVRDFFGEGGRRFVVMDFVDGKTLHSLLEAQGRFSEQQVLTWASELLAVLDYLHARTPPIIYRDIKPENIMVQADGRLKLIDFNIARRFKPGQGSDTARYGTEGYAAPEQYGKGQTDARSDLYSLSVLLHQLLTGHDPGLTPMNLPPLRSSSVRVAPYMAAAIEAGLQIDRNQRPASAQQMAQQLRISLGEGGSSGDGGGGSLPAPVGGRPTWLLPLLAALLLLLAAAVSVQAFFRNRTPQPPEVAAIITFAPADQAGGPTAPPTAAPSAPPHTATAIPSEQLLGITPDATDLAATRLAAEATELVAAVTENAPALNAAATRASAEASATAATPQPAVLTAAQATDTAIAATILANRLTLAAINAEIETASAQTAQAERLNVGATQTAQAQAAARNAQATQTAQAVRNWQATQTVQAQQVAARNWQATQTAQAQAAARNWQATQTAQAQQAAARNAQATQTAQAQQAAARNAQATQTAQAARPTCNIAVANRFQSAYSANAGALGCATGGEATVFMAEQTFERGRMFWRQDNGMIYAVYNGGGLGVYRDNWREGQNEYTCGSGPTPPTPKRGFNKVWCENAAVRNGLGNATTGEFGQNNRLQNFSNGWTLDNGARIYVFFNNGSWR